MKTLTLLSYDRLYINSGNYNKALEYNTRTFNLFEELRPKEEYEWLLLEIKVSQFLSYKYLGREYDSEEIRSLIKLDENPEDIMFELNYNIYQLIDDTSYLETAYNQIQET